MKEETDSLEHVCWKKVSRCGFTVSYGMWYVRVTLEHFDE